VILHALGILAVDLFKSRAGLKLRICFSVTNSTSPYGGPHRVFDCAAVTGRSSY
jgi:hypothetical protein